MQVFPELDATLSDEGFVRNLKIFIHVEGGREICQMLDQEGFNLLGPVQFSETRADLWQRDAPDIVLGAIDREGLDTAIQEGHSRMIHVGLRRNVDHAGLFRRRINNEQAAAGKPAIERVFLKRSLGVWPLLRDLQRQARPKPFLRARRDALCDVIIFRLQNVAGNKPYHCRGIVRHLVNSGTWRYAVNHHAGFILFTSGGA